MAGSKLPTELFIQIAAFLEPDACYCLIQALGGLDQLLAHADFTRKARGTGDTIVHLAASKGDEKFIQTMLARAVNIQVRNNRGDTPLARAAHRGHKAVVEQLIAAGAKVDEPDNRGLTALHCAAYHGSDMVVQVLLDSGANISKTAGYHGTALHLAARNGHLSTVSLLWGRRLRSQDTTEIYNGVLDRTAEYGRTAVFQQLIEAGFKVSDKTLQVAVSSGRVKIVKILLSQTSFPENVMRAALLQSVELGYSSVVRLLIGKGLIVSGEDIKLAESVGCSGSIKTLRLLHNAGADYAQQNQNRLSMLEGAARRGHTIFVRHLAHSGWLTRDMCTRALVVATSAGHSAVVKTLLDYGSKFDKGDKGRALYQASMNGHLAIQDLLLEPGTQPYYLLALYPAICEGQVERVRAILGYGINTSTPDWETDVLLRMSLWRAAEHGYTTIVKLLLDAGVPPDAFRYGKRLICTLPSSQERS